MAEIYITMQMSMCFDQRSEQMTHCISIAREISGLIPASIRVTESQPQVAVLRRPVARPLPTPPPTLLIPEPDTAFWLTKAMLVSGRQIREANLTCMEQLTRMFPST